ncbi:amidase domain-containing protein [Nocardioides sp. 503]|uniref:amidase domain-containing protein n=1 Tax=Nocardioides sp. 503 TaxID=2508326 RepID=UPI00106F1BB5|nr:amidase domain-containing protein [Nocardioides sp. 503]
MSDHPTPDMRPTRRGMLRLAGSSAAAIAVGGLGAGAARGAAPAERSVAEAVEQYLAARAAAADSTRAATLRGPASASVLRFERERAGYLRSLGRTDDWNGTMLGLGSQGSGLEVTQESSSSAVVHLRDTTRITWAPHPRPVTGEALQGLKSEPARYGAGRKPGTAVTSGISVPHELRLERSTSGWFVVSDAYAEPSLFGDSPDLVDSRTVQAYAATADRQQPVSPEKSLASTSALAAVSGTYDWQAAVNYAASYWSSYNANYAVYNSCGGDCANFVSQCLFRGDQKPDGSGYWRRYNGSACGYSNRWCGTDRWVNNWLLRNWTINQGRGLVSPGIGGLGYGDIVNYDWDQNGTYQHVSIVTDPVNNLVTAHNNDHYNVPWKLGDTTANHTFTHMWLNYPQ